MPYLSAVLITQAFMFFFIIRKQNLITVNYYFNGIGNMSLEMSTLSDNFCVEISLQMNYFRKSKTILMMFWPI